MHAVAQDSPAPSGPRDPVVLIVDDDPTLTRLLESWLQSESYRVRVCPDGESCISTLSETLVEAVLLDLHLPGIDGIDTLRQIRERSPSLPVLILTAETEIDVVVEAMRQGAYDYLTKPLNRNELVNRLKHAVEKFQMELRVTRLEREAGRRGYPGIVGKSPTMQAVYEEMDRLASSDITALVVGESGTGKELVARGIHGQSARADGPFIAVNCAAIPDTLQESELFGHEKGAFTGATARRIGKFEQAHRGTLFLDEIAELSLPAQAKLLRVLQERKYHRVGGSQELFSDFRLIAATHRDLMKRVADNRFREDLFFRIAVYELSLPPLRERLADLDDLTRHFLETMARQQRQKVQSLAEDTRAALAGYTWPGNVRELENAIQRALVAADGQIEPRHLPARVVASSPGRSSDAPAGGTDDAGVPESGPAAPAASAPVTAEAGSNGAQRPPPPPSASAEQEGFLDSSGMVKPLEEIEREAILAALERLDGNLSRVCRELGIGRTTLYRKLKQYGLR